MLIFSDPYFKLLADSCFNKNYCYVMANRLINEDIKGNRKG